MLILNIFLLLFLTTNTTTNTITNHSSSTTTSNTFQYRVIGHFGTINDHISLLLHNKSTFAHQIAIIHNNSLDGWSPYQYDIPKHNLILVFQCQSTLDLKWRYKISNAIINAQQTILKVFDPSLLFTTDLNNLPTPKVLLSLPTLLVYQVHDQLADFLPSLTPTNTRVYRVDLTLSNYTPPHLTQSVGLLHLRTLLTTLNPEYKDQRIQSLINSINLSTIKHTVQYLTGETKPQSPRIKSRHSFSRGYLYAAKYISQQFEKYGCDVVEFMEYKELYGPNVVCTILGSSFQEQQVILGAHLDSRGTLFIPNGRAPGANDDASGCSMLISTLQSLNQSKLKLKRTLKLIAFSGEEQGLVGSHAYARQCVSNNDQIMFMLQADMIGYKSENSSTYQCGLPNVHATTEANSLIHLVAQTYVPQVQVGSTDACCSDHQSFYEAGVPSTQIFERNGPIVDPMYHKSLDVSKRVGFDFHQIRFLSQIALATIVTVAELD